MTRQPRLFRNLRIRRVGPAVDDSGTGYSSLSRLPASPVSQFAVVQTFVNAITTAAPLARIIPATVAMPHGPGLIVVAEGAENSDQLHHLRGLGCAYAHGLLLARPRDAEGVSELRVSAPPWARLFGWAGPKPRPSLR